MPTYEYQCAKCGHEFEREQRITEEPVKKCPACRSSQARRLISATSFVLKGGGWYSDLYASAKGKSEGADKGESKGSGEAAKSDAATGSSAKPAADKPSVEKSPGKKPAKAKPTAAA